MTGRFGEQSFTEMRSNFERFLEEMTMTIVSDEDISAPFVGRRVKEGVLSSPVLYISASDYSNDEVRCTTIARTYIDWFECQHQHLEAVIEVRRTAEVARHGMERRMSVQQPFRMGGHLPRFTSNHDS